MVEEIVGQIIADVSEDTAAEHLHGRIPVVEENRLRQLPVGSCQYHKQCRWHDKTILVHGEVVVDAVEQEVECQAGWVIRKPPRKECELFDAGDGRCGIILINVEEKAMHQILDQSPEANTADPVRGSGSRII